MQTCVCNAVHAAGLAVWGEENLCSLAVFENPFHNSVELLCLAGTQCYSVLGRLGSDSPSLLLLCCVPFHQHCQLFPGSSHPRGKIDPKGGWDVLSYTGGNTSMSKWSLGYKVGVGEWCPVERRKSGPKNLNEAELCACPHYFRHMWCPGWGQQMKSHLHSQPFCFSL